VCLTNLDVSFFLDGGVSMVKRNAKVKVGLLVHFVRNVMEHEAEDGNQENV
jgi:hypothetical protein